MDLRAINVADVLVQQRNALISEIQNLKEENEVQINALNLTHEMAVRSLEDNHQRELKKRATAGRVDAIAICVFFFNAAWSWFFL
jgi:hypothetical protein